MRTTTTFHHIQQLQLIQVYCLIVLLATQTNVIYMKPDDMPDAEDFDENDNWEEGLTEFDRQRHRSVKDDQDLIEDEDDSFVDELDEEE